MLMTNALTMQIHPKDGASYPVEVNVTRVGCSRYASRDVEATESYLKEVRSNGYLVHETAGVCFRSRYLLTNEDAIEVQGPQTTGEAEFVAIRHQGSIYVAPGSDHNDRSLNELWTSMLGKISDTAKTKQMVPAVVARDAWLYDDLKGHWDEIVVKSSVTVSGQSVPYQEFKLGELLDLEYYLDSASWLQQDGSVLLGGSGSMVPNVPENVYQGQIGFEGVIFPADFHFEMIDPVLDRSLAHGYDIICLEEPGSLSL